MGHKLMSGEQVEIEAGPTASTRVKPEEWVCSR